MTIEGWITMIISISGVTTLTVWCFIKVFTSSNKKSKSTIDLITPDMEDYNADQAESK